MSKRHAPATARNREAILAVLQDHLPETGLVLEVASGTGEHAASFAPLLAPRIWQPSDIDAGNLASIAAWRAEAAAANLRAPVRLDVQSPSWPIEAADLSAIVAINLVHIADYAVTEALFAGAGRLLSPGGVLYLYGPFKRDGVHTAPSNAAFDERLRSENPAWGVRDMSDLAVLGKQHGLIMAEPVAMPANNFSLIFEKAGS